MILPIKTHLEAIPPVDVFICEEPDVMEKKTLF